MRRDRRQPGPGERARPGTGRPESNSLRGGGEGGRRAGGAACALRPGPRGETADARTISAEGPPGRRYATHPREAMEEAPVRELVIDDSRARRAVLRQILSELGFGVSEASHG